MSTKVIISRNTGAHEQVVIEVVSKDPAEIRAAFRLTDERAWTMMRRSMDGDVLMRRVANLSPEAYRAAYSAQEFLFSGQVQPPANVEQYAEPANGDAPVETPVSEPMA